MPGFSWCCSGNGGLGSLIVVAICRSSEFRKILGRRPVHHAPVGIEARAVAGAIPRGFRRVPADDAAEVRTDRGMTMQFAGFIAEDGHFAESVANDGPGVGRDLVDG